MTEQIFCPEHGVVDAEIIDDGKLHVFKDHVHVILKNSSRAVLWESSSAVLWESSRAELWGSSRAELRGSSSAVLWESSRAVLWESSSAELRGSSSAELRGSSRAVLWESSSAELWSLFAAAILRDKTCKATGGKAKQRIALLSQPTAPREWLELVGARMNGRNAILYKRTSENFTTAKNFLYTIGKIAEAPDWNPKPECGGGLHFCISPAGCDAFRDGKDDRYIACLVDPKDIVIHAQPEYPDKIKAKKCKVLYECDREGKQIEGSKKK
jgi:hypothetical protein